MLKSRPFTHLVLTRFNVRLSNATTTRKGINPDWLKSRLFLFEDYCFQSLKNQSNKDFKWLLILDVDTPAEFKNTIDALAVNWDSFKPVYVDFPVPEGVCPAELKELIKQHIYPNTEHLITTRIDNDDAVSVDFIDSIQQQFSNQACECLNFVFGYQFNNNELYVDVTMGNHFISLIERFDPKEFHTVFAKHHSNMYELGSVKHIFSKPNWVEVVHGQNLYNFQKGGLKVSPDVLHTRFSIKQELIPVTSKSPFENAVNKAFFIVILLPRFIFMKIFNRLKHHRFRGLG